MNEQLTLDLDGIEPIIEQNRIEEQYASLPEKIERAKQILVLAADMSKKYYGKPLVVTYSGGKDSDVMLDIALKCLKSDEFEVLNSHTTVDPPEVVYHTRSVFNSLKERGIKTTIHYPVDKNGNPTSMWKLIIDKQAVPTRFQRFCCETLKESSTPDRMCATGVRSDESKGRQGRDVFSLKAKGGKFNFYSFDHAEEVHRESQEIQDDNWDCTLIRSMKEHGNVIVNPIYYFNEADIWEYIKQNDVNVCVLYSRGWKRVGCIACPLAGRKQMIKELNDYPTYKLAYINAFDKMLQRRRENGKDDVSEKSEWHQWRTGQDVFNWWIREGMDNCYGQINLFE